MQKSKSRKYKEVEIEIKKIRKLCLSIYGNDYCDGWQTKNQMFKDFGLKFRKQNNDKLLFHVMDEYKFFLTNIKYNI